MRRYEGIYEAFGLWGWGFRRFVEGLVDHCDWVVVHFDCGSETPPEAERVVNAYRGEYLL